MAFEQPIILFEGKKQRAENLVYYNFNIIIQLYVRRAEILNCSTQTLVKIIGRKRHCKYIMKKFIVEYSTHEESRLWAKET